MNILISGGTGFIGYNLVKSMLNNKNDNIFCLVRNKNTKVFKDYPDLKLITSSDLIDENNKNEINLIVHLATHFVGNHTNKDVKALVEANIFLGIMLLDFSRIHNIKFINTSSFAQHVDGYSGMPQNLYAATKKSFNEILKFYGWQYGLLVIDLELYDSYGPGDTRNKFFNQAFTAFSRNIDFKMSPGEQEICLIYVDDIIKAIKHSMIMISDLTGYNEYSLAEAKNIIKLKELAFLIKDKLKSNSKIDASHYSYRENGIFTIKTSRSILPGWKSSVTLDQGIEQYLNYYK